jgi:hypothetical protein
MTTEKKLEMLQRKQEFLWEQLDEVMEYAENSYSVSLLMREIDIVKSKILELEISNFYKELEDECDE